MENFVRNVKDRFYAVQVGDNYDCDYGSTVKREALRKAKLAAKLNPNMEVRIALMETTDSYCHGVIIIHEGER